MQEINSLVNNNKITKLLSYDNLNTENYNDSIDYVNNSLDIINKDIDKLIDLSEEESIRNYILKYDLDKYYVDLYNDYMFSDEISSKFNLDSDYLLKYREAINTKLSACSDVFKFLNENSDDNYSFEDGEIKFKTNELLDKYNQYIELIKS